MRKLYTLAYPKLRDADCEWINDFRRDNDVAYRDVVAPHFTLLFGCAEVDEARYVEHVEAVAQSQAPLSFCCRYAMVANDDTGANFHIFLVPEEGYSGISKLHDRLYQGIMEPHLRLDLPFIPHITIATNPIPKRIKALSDELNSRGLTIEGSIDAITVCSFDGLVVTDLRQFFCT